MEHYHIFNSDLYHREAMSFRCPESDNLPYSVFGLLEEVAELLQKSPIVYRSTLSGYASRIVIKLIIRSGLLLGRWAKRIRKGKSEPPFNLRPTDITHQVHDELQKEAGDIHWMVVSLDDQYGLYTSDVNTVNIHKLAKRRDTNTIITHKDH